MVFFPHITQFFTMMAYPNTIYAAKMLFLNVYWTLYQEISSFSFAVLISYVKL
jgi:hypothetical protein